MNSVFEGVVEQAVKDVVGGVHDWTVTEQASARKLVSGGPRPITIRPDILVTDADGTDRIVGDAKWKRDDPSGRGREPSTSDVYQLVAYQLAHETPGVLFYPAQDGRIESTYDVHRLAPLVLVEVPVRGTEDTGLRDRIRQRVRDRLPITTGDGEDRD
jgi:5-methylcytosine-specific restriction endonuclease McrBC regulatory subunit McrC